MAEPEKKKKKIIGVDGQKFTRQQVKSRDPSYIKAVKESAARSDKASPKDPPANTYKGAQKRAHETSGVIQQKPITTRLAKPGTPQREKYDQAVRANYPSSQLARARNALAARAQRGKKGKPASQKVQIAGMQEATKRHGIDTEAKTEKYGTDVGARTRLKESADKLTLARDEKIKKAEKTAGKALEGERKAKADRDNFKREQDIKKEEKLQGWNKEFAKKVRDTGVNVAKYGEELSHLEIETKQLQRDLDSMDPKNYDAGEIQVVKDKIELKQHELEIAQRNHVGAQMELENYIDPEGAKIRNQEQKVQQQIAGQPAPQQPGQVQPGQQQPVQQAPQQAGQPQQQQTQQQTQQQPQQAQQQPQPQQAAQGAPQPLPPDQSQLQVGIDYQLRDGRIGRWNGQGFDPIG